MSIIFYEGVMLCYRPRPPKHINSHLGRWVQRLMQERTDYPLSPADDVFLELPQEARTVLPQGSTGLERFVTEQIQCMHAQKMTPNDAIEEYTGTYPDKANWDDVEAVLVDFYYHTRDALIKAQEDENA